MSKQDVTQAYQDLFFADEPAGQRERAYALLSGLEKLHTEKTADDNRLRISYSLLDYSLEGLETALKNAGFCFKENLLDKLGKQLIYCCDTALPHNNKIGRASCRERV